jgi:hypothetical protein
MTNQYNLTCDCPCGATCAACRPQHQVGQAERCARGPACIDATWHTVLIRHADKVVEERREKLSAWHTNTTRLCRLCHIHTKAAVGALANDWRDLQLLLPKGASPLYASAGGTRDLPVPIRLSVAVLAEAIVDELDRWADVVAERHAADHSDRGQPARRLSAAVGWCYYKFDTLVTLGPTTVARLDSSNPHMSGRDHLDITLETGLDGALRLLDLHEQADTLTGHTRRAERLWSPCPMCQRLALEHPEGSATVHCRRCSHSMTLDGYDQLANILTRAYAPAGTAA